MNYDTVSIGAALTGNVLSFVLCPSAPPEDGSPTTCLPISSSAEEFQSGEGRREAALDQTLWRCYLESKENEAMVNTGSMKRYFIAWWKLSRVPFLFVGILPLILGFILAWRWGYKGPPGLYVLSTATVVLIMWMTYYVGDWNDLEGDRINRDFNRFSGGSRVLVGEALPGWVSLLLGYGCLAGAILIGSYIYLRYQTDLRTLVLGGLGLFFGFFYSTRPFRWSYRGLGEVLIGFCYGWLPIATGFFLLTGFFSPQILLLSIPVGLSVFNVILINEFPDHEADHAIGKRTLVVRFGRERMGDLYVGLSVLTGFSFIKMMWGKGASPYWLLLLAGIPCFLILWNLIQVWKGNYHDHGKLELLCRNTLFVNLSMTMLLTIQQTLLLSSGGKLGSWIILRP